MDFLQAPPILSNTFHDDPTLRAYCARALPTALFAAIEPDLAELGAYAAASWSKARLETPKTPNLISWSAWGERIDHIETTPTWQRGAELTARYGFVAAGHEPQFGALARVDQFLRVYLYHVPSQFHSCPLAMSDGAATALKAAGNRALCERALPHLLARDPAHLWLSGQWMTELAGGSDVGNTDTIAQRGEHGQWRLHGRKWFTSAVVGDMALALARPQGAAPGADALALFYLESRKADGAWNGIRIDRLKDKLGTRELPTAEVHLDGAQAIAVGELANGVRQITPVLNISRTWNAVGAIATMRHCLTLALDYANRREAFGRTLASLPLHRATLAHLIAEFEAAFQLVFCVIELLGREEHEQHEHADDALMLRVLTPLAKLWTGKLAVRIASETCEAFGGAGYIEDTGIPQLLRDAQVFPIWEGTTNVLALDVLRALGRDSLDVFSQRLLNWCDSGTGDTQLQSALATAQSWFAAHAGKRPALESGARGFAMTLARCAAAAVLARHAHWAASAQHDTRAHAALSLFIEHGLVRLDTIPMDAVAALVDNGRS
ncbi:MAG: acyl-CoA dehydrogenase family protein [Dokdonella sp.]|uniref:acyl-CoA dehydrogenase family protein n=1 Tax=Dokdonella sp. TaxID=2291710 RepID=UPI0025C64A9A|nr:acyl-CoA dehydrogenase family protein [Dokdonella sp.]MBZ0222468.1 acyl-CoA dehydrogenase family protein [Dokdonella sp.]MCC7255366.1 acyl-CoA dehydrogenase family protein [Dokdonella sp.]